MDNDEIESRNNLATDEILVLLQEKRTALAAIRIGVSTIMAQTAVLGLLIATSGYYRWMEVLHLLIPYAVLNVVVFCIGAFFIVKPLVQLYRLDREILSAKERYRECTRIPPCG